MKKIIFAVLAAVMVISLAACGGSKTSTKTEQTTAPAVTPAATAEPTADASDNENSGTISNILVAYFSATGNTRTIAEYIADSAKADIYEIVPETPYTDEDLNYGNNNSRTSTEQNDTSARPVISGTVENIEQYDVIFLGYPIWWGEAPKIMYTFLESYDFTGKTIIPFCTSGSSPIGTSALNMRPSAPDADWYDGDRLDSSSSREDIASWVEKFDLGTE